MVQEVALIPQIGIEISVKRGLDDIEQVFRLFLWRFLYSFSHSVNSSPQHLADGCHCDVFVVE